jgi:transaldolase
MMELKAKIFADGADRGGMLEMYRSPHVAGFTTNPTLMRRAGVTEYEAFARDILRSIPDRPISFEVFSEEPEETERQARRIASWGDNVYVKIPVTNTRGQSSCALISALAHSGVKVNVTALMPLEQVGSRQPAVSANLVHALDYARQIGARVAGIVGRDGGYTAQVADACVVVPTVDPRFVTPLAEGFQAVIWHLLVSQPDIQVGQMTWESVGAGSGLEDQAPGAAGAPT